MHKDNFIYKVYINYIYFIYLFISEKKYFIFKNERYYGLTFIRKYKALLKLGGDDDGERGVLRIY